MVTYIGRMVVVEKKWIDQESFQDGVALCQVIPGATAMQTAAYAGLKVRGVRGAFACYIGFGLPAFVLMLALSFAYSRAHSLPAVVSLFSGLQAVIVAVVAKATLTFGRTTLRNLKSAAIALVATILFALMTNPALIVLLAALLGMVSNSKDLPAARNARHFEAIRHTTIPLLFLLIASAASFATLFFVQRPLFELALLMSRIDIMAFGGGFASVPLMFHEIVEVRSWMNAAAFLDGIVLGQFTPGPIVITATFVGYMVHGPLGGVISTIAIFLPSFLILIGVAPWFDRLRASARFNKAIGGILSSFVGLLLTVTIRFATQVHWDLPHISLATAAFVALFFELDILWVVLAGAAISAFAL